MQMSLETAKASVDFLIAKSGENKTLSLTFFGGEPLLRFDLIKELVNYSNIQATIHNKKFTFDATTNGSMFTEEILEFFFENDIGILFSWDGDKERITNVKGKEAYNKMHWSIKELNKRGFHAQARVTVDPNELRIKDYINHIREVGFESIIFVGASGISGWTQEKADTVYMDIAEQVFNENRQGRIFKEIFIITDMLFKLGLDKPPIVPCGAGRGLVGITTDGKVLPCQHPATWEKDYCLGNVVNKTINEELIKPFLNYKREEVIGCKDCIAKSICPGACPQLNYRYNKDMKIPYLPDCLWTRARYKAIDHIYNELYVKEKNPVFIRWALKEKLWPVIRGWTRELFIDELDRYPKNNLKGIWIKLRETELDKSAGDKILGFLKDTNKDRHWIASPLPPCIFGSKYSEIQKKYSIPKSKAEFPKENNAETKRLRELYNSYTKTAKLPSKCKSCIYHFRNSCDYCYFGLEN